MILTVDFRCVCIGQVFILTPLCLQQSPWTRMLFQNRNGLLINNIQSKHTEDFPPILTTIKQQALKLQHKLTQNQALLYISMICFHNFKCNVNECKFPLLFLHQLIAQLSVFKFIWTMCILYLYPPETQQLICCPFQWTSVIGPYLCIKLCCPFERTVWSFQCYHMCGGVILATLSSWFLKKCLPSKLAHFMDI